MLHLKHLVLLQLHTLLIVAILREQYILHLGTTLNIGNNDKSIIY